MEHDPDDEDIRQQDETRSMGSHGDVVPVASGPPAATARDGVIVPIPGGRPPVVGPGRHGPGRRGPSKPAILLTVLLFAAVVVIMVLVTRGGTTKKVATTTSPTATQAGAKATASAAPSSAAPSASSGPSATDGPPSLGANPVPGKPGSTFLGNAVDTSSEVDPNQDTTISGKDYPNSTRVGCPTDGQPDDWSAAGYRTFTAMVGVADNEPNAEGETVTVTFYDQDRRELAAARSSVGHPQSVSVALKSATRLALTCSVSPSGDSFNITLGNAALNP